MIGKAGPVVAALGLAIAATLAPVPVQAWQYVYGPSPDLEAANKRVAPVRSCFGGGYIAVGSSGVGGGANPDVFVVRTDATGARLWEERLDVNSGRRLANEGVAIAEIPRGGGFVVLSNTLEGGIWYPALTHISCYGFETWTHIYPDWRGIDVLGKDLIRAANGDFAVAGIHAHSSEENGWLMRTDSAGNVLWEHYFRILGRQGFHALTEAERLPGQQVGDLVAVGRHASDLSRTQGLVARVRGIDGSLGFPPGCMATHGWGGSDAVYNSVIQLRTGLYAGQFAMVGTATDPNGLSDIWAVRADPCTIGSQSLIGDANSFASEEGYDLREVQAPSAGIPLGSLAIAGLFTPPGGGWTDGVLVYVSPGAPMAYVAGSRFGDFTFGSESFSSLEETPAAPTGRGFVLAGQTTADWENIGDPSDLYLVYHDPEEPGLCHTSWWPLVIESNASASGLVGPRKTSLSPREVGTAREDLKTAFPICEKESSVELPAGPWRSGG